MGARKCSTEKWSTCCKPAFFLLATTLCAQSTNTGVIFGVLSDRVAHLVASAPITAKNAESGRIYTVNSGPTGEFRITGLPAGEYTVSVEINLIGTFSQPPTKVAGNDPVRFDIMLPLP
jgi:Carboxypeptidase regulatory-like domain